MARRLFILAVLLSCLRAAMIAQSADGILITQRVTSGGAPLTIQMQIQAARIRTEMAGPNGVTSVTIFDGSQQVLYNIDPVRRTYTEMTQADVAQLGAQLQVGPAEIQAQIEKLPAAQRAQMEAMMKGVELTRTGVEQVGRWTCDNYELTLAGQKIGERCTVSLATLGFTAADFDVMNQMGAFNSVISPQLAGQLPAQGGVDAQGGADFPVKTVLMTPGGTVTTEVIEVGRRTFSDSSFAVPAGFTKQKTK
jgi:hypothetical protein